MEKLDDNQVEFYLIKKLEEKYKDDTMYKFEYDPDTHEGMFSLSIYPKGEVRDMGYVHNGNNLAGLDSIIEFMFASKKWVSCTITSIDPVTGKYKENIDWDKIHNEFSCIFNEGTYTPKEEKDD